MQAVTLWEILWADDYWHRLGSWTPPSMSRPASGSVRHPGTPASRYPEQSSEHSPRLGHTETVTVITRLYMKAEWLVWGCSSAPMIRICQPLVGVRSTWQGRLQTCSCSSLPLWRCGCGGASLMNAGIRCVLSRFLGQHALVFEYDVPSVALTLLQHCDACVCSSHVLK